MPTCLKVILPSAERNRSILKRRVADVDLYVEMLASRGRCGVLVSENDGPALPYADWRATRSELKLPSGLPDELKRLAGGEILTPLELEPEQVALKPRTICKPARITSRSTRRKTSPIGAPWMQQRFNTGMSALGSFAMRRSVHVVNTFTSRSTSPAMRDGLYGVVFTTPLGESSGVVHLTDGKVVGGGSTLFYYGSYKSDGPDFSATIVVEDYTQGTDPAFSRERMTIDLTGTFYGVSARFMGTSPEVPGFSLSASMTRLNTGSLFDGGVVPLAHVATTAKHEKAPSVHLPSLRIADDRSPLNVLAIET